jgi:hypothetical protein
MHPTSSGAGAEHLLQISVIRRHGFLAAKTIAADISDALAGAGLVLARGTLVSLLFLRASARRIDEGEVRRIDLTFRARVVSNCNQPFEGDEPWRFRPARTF